MCFGDLVGNVVGVGEDPALVNDEAAAGTLPLAAHLPRPVQGQIRLRAR